MDSWAVIDVGTNSVRLLVAEVRNGKVITIARQIDSTRLGEGLYHDWLLKQPALRRTANAVSRFIREAQNLGVSGIAIVATSAARDALNRAELSMVIEKETGYALEVLSGNQEAGLSFLGATSSFSCLPDPVVLDIGGGSTELVYRNKEGTIDSLSLKLGAVRCTELGMGCQEIRDQLWPSLEHLAARQGLVGVGGTITSLAAMEQELTCYDPELVHGFVLGLATIKKWRYRLAGMSMEARQQVKGLQPARADIMPAGLAILEGVMDGLQVNCVTVSEADLLEGLVLSLAGYSF